VENCVSVFSTPKADWYKREIIVREGSKNFRARSGGGGESSTGVEIVGRSITAEASLFLIYPVSERNCAFSSRLVTRWKNYLPPKSREVRSLKLRRISKKENRRNRRANLYRILVFMSIPYRSYRMVRSNEICSSYGQKPIANIREKSLTLRHQSACRRWVWMLKCEAVWPAFMIIGKVWARGARDSHHAVLGNGAREALEQEHPEFAMRRSITMTRSRWNYEWLTDSSGFVMRLSGAMRARSTEGKVMDSYNQGVFWKIWKKLALAVNGVNKSSRCQAGRRT